MRVILRLSHNDEEVEHKDSWPIISRATRRLFIVKENGETIKKYDLFDIEKLEWFPR